jgi:divalent metal cation (Fe/Co/Zn/Cd) transporter
MTAGGDVTPPGRTAREMRAGIRVEWVTIAWMLLELAVGLAAGIAAGSVALVAFSLDSLIELISAGVLLRRLLIERQAGPDATAVIARAEKRASRVVGWSLLALAAYVTIEAVYRLVAHRVAEASVVGIALAAAALVVMPVLVRIKLRVAAAIGSAALRGDAMCGVVCAWMAGVLLLGLGLRAAFGWWWADPAAALGLVYFIVQEGREALHSG